MLNLQKINWKLRIKNPEIFNSEVLFKVFNSWISNSEEIFIDVAGYKHVDDGPWVVLVGHYVDYAWDYTDRVHGFSYNRRQPMDGTNQEKISASLRAILQAALRFQGAAEFKVKPEWDRSELAFAINDRGLAPNTDQTLAGVLPDLKQVMDRVNGAGSYSLTRDARPRQRFTVKIQPQQFDPQGWLDRLT